MSLMSLSAATTILISYSEKLDVEFKPVDKSSTSLTAYIAPAPANNDRDNNTAVNTRALFFQISRIAKIATASITATTIIFKYRNAKMLYLKIVNINKAVSKLYITNKLPLTILNLFFARANPPLLFRDMINHFLYKITPSYYSTKLLDFSFIFNKILGKNQNIIAGNYVKTASYKRLLYILVLRFLNKFITIHLFKTLFSIIQLIPDDYLA